MSILYNEATKKLIHTFGSLFDNVSVHREASDGFKMVKIPIHFAPGQYDYQDMLQHPVLLDIRPSISLPLFTYEITRYEMDTSRKENRYYSKTNCETNADGSFGLIRSPTPYIVGISLYLFTHYLDDLYEVQEKIFTGFNPKITVQIKHDNGIISQVPIVFTNLSKIDNYVGNPKDKSRLITTTFNFEAKMDYYKTVGENVNLIKTIDLVYKDQSDNETEFTQTVAVDPIDANITDDWVVKKTLVEGDSN